MSLIDILTIPICPACDRDLNVDAIGSLSPTYLTDANGDHWLTCGRCGDFENESLEALQAGEIFEL